VVAVTFIKHHTLHGCNVKVYIHDQTYVMESLKSVSAHSLGQFIIYRHIPQLTGKSLRKSFNSVFIVLGEEDLLIGQTCFICVLWSCSTCSRNSYLFIAFM